MPNSVLVAYNIFCYLLLFTRKIKFYISAKNTCPNLSYLRRDNSFHK